MAERTQSGEETRTRIIAAATEMLRDGGGERPSVRAVAARAGVGASTLRHYFPTQRELLDTVLSSVYEAAAPDERIRDTSVPARERLIECLWRMLDPVGSPAESRETWISVFDAFIGPNATEESRLGYLVLQRQALRRIESWIAILSAEGALGAGDNDRRARFLLVVIDGLSIGRALPAESTRLEDEAAALADAVDAVLGPFPVGSISR